MTRTPFFPIALESDLYRPFLAHRHIYVLTVLTGQHCNDFVNVVLAGRSKTLDGIAALETERNHNLVWKPALTDFTEPVGGHYAVADPGKGSV